MPWAKPSVLVEAVAVSEVTTPEADSVGRDALMSAATPETSGAANDVPSPER